MDVKTHSYIKRKKRASSSSCLTIGELNYYLLLIYTTTPIIATNTIVGTIGSVTSRTNTFIMCRCGGTIISTINNVSEVIKNHIFSFCNINH